MEAKLYSLFMFYRMQADFRKLPQNVQITAKQDFENLIDSQQDRMFIRTYMTYGINDSSDFMIWRIESSISKLQEMSAAAQKTGLGKWLDTEKSFMGIAEESAANEYGRLPYMLITPLRMTEKCQSSDEKKKNNILSFSENSREFLFPAGLSWQYDYLCLIESSSAENLRISSNELEEKNSKENLFSHGKSYFCIGRDISEILDFLA